MARSKYVNIKIRRETHEKLSSMLGPGETFDQLLNRLTDRVDELERELYACNEAFKAFSLKREAEAIKLDKAAWYITKMIFSIQALKDLILLGRNGDEIKKQLLKLERVLNQIRTRYNVETSEVLEIAKQFVETKDKEDLILLNEATKEVVKGIIVVMLGVEIKHQVQGEKQ